MSQAKVHRAAKARKKWTCGKCGTEVQVGEPVLSFSVGFRGREQRRCDRPSCYPTRAERESSMTAPVYDAIDSADWSACQSLDDLQETLAEIAGVLNEVADEYEASEMYERNEDLQMRAETLREGVMTLESWDPGETEPVEDDPKTWEGEPTYEAAKEAWLENMREAAQQTADEVEVP